MMVAKMPAGFPKPKKRMPGSRYTKLGMVCMPSRMGRIMLLASWLRAPSMPNGRPIDIATITVTTISAMVFSVFSQRPIKPM